MAWLVEISTPTPTGWLLVRQYKLERSARRIFARMKATIDPGVSLRLVSNLEIIEEYEKLPKTDTADPANAFASQEQNAFASRARDERDAAGEGSTLERLDCK